MNEFAPNIDPEDLGIEAKEETASEQEATEQDDAVEQQEETAQIAEEESINPASDEAVLQAEAPVVDQPEYPGVVEDPLNPGYTVGLIEINRARAMMRFMTEKASKIASTRSGDTSIAKGMLCHIGEGMVGKVIDITMTHDHMYNMKRKTMSVITLEAPGTTEGVVTFSKNFPRPLSEPIEVPDKYADEVNIERDGVTYSLGDRISVKEVPEFFGKVAQILDQNKYPDQLVVILRDLKGRTQLFRVRIEDIEKI